MALFWRKRRRGTLRGRKKKEKNLFWHFLYGFVTIFIVVLLGFTIWYVTHLPRVTITSIVVTGGETVSHDEVRSVVKSELTGSYLHLIPKAFTYLYPSELIVEKVNAIPRVYDARVTRLNRNEIEISFSEYVPHALWCNTKDVRSTCLFVTDKGYAFVEAPMLYGNSITRYFVEGEYPTSMNYVLESDTFEASQNFIVALSSELAFRVRSVTQTVDGDFVYELSGGGKLLVSPNVRAQDTIENLRLVLRSKEFSHITSSNFNYIDLRFGNKVFVNEEFGDATTSELLPEDIEL